MGIMHFRYGQTTAKLSVLLMTAAATPAMAQVIAASDSQVVAASDSGAEDIVVTAQRRSESLQSVPISITVLNTQKLENLQVRNFNDYIAFLPSASFTTGSIGTPGNSSVSFRGIVTNGGLITSGSLPTVGTYLDEQPVTSILGTVDIHVYDIARVEALAGPQGTLFGASSLAGTIRIISNQPDNTQFSARVDADANSILGRGAGGQLEGYVNIPIVKDKIALRAVGWYTRTGGFIDNVFGSRTFRSSGITQRNDALVEDNHNPVDTVGMRALLGIELDDNWTVTPSVIAQQTKWRGSFQSDDDNAGVLNVAHFFPEFGKDLWYQVGGTITGKIADFEVTYAGYYMNRRLDTQNDYSDYGFFYDLVSGSGAGVVDNLGRLIDPSQINTNRVRLNKLSQELRVASPADKRLRGQAGLFYQRQFQRDENNFLTPGFADRLSVPGRPGQVWLTLQDRVDKDYAAFAQVDFDATDKLLLTGGVRAYRFDNSLVGFFGVNTTFFGTGVRQCLGRAAGSGPFGVGQAVVPGTPCTNLGIQNADGSISPKRAEGSGFTWRANATYRLTPENIVYATFSTGFRPGGINRAGTAEAFGADTLFNYEIGTKNTFFDRRFTANLTLFWQDWRDVQVAFQPPGGSGVVLVGNVGSAESKGIEAEFTWREDNGLSLTASGTYVDAQLTEPFVLFGNVTAPAGTRLPLTPRFKGNIIGRYDWDIGPNRAHVQLAGVYVGERNPVVVTRDLAKTGVLPAFATLDGAVGLTGGGWNVEVYMRNITDTRGQLSRAARCNINFCGPSSADPVGQIYSIFNQPRTLGIRVGRQF